MAIAQRSGGTVSVYFGGAGPKLLALPAACQPGDVAIVCAVASPVSWATPSGWTAITLNSAAGNIYASTWYRVIQAGDVSWSFGSGSMSNASLIFVAFTGVYSVTPIDVVGTASNVTGPSPSQIVANSITISTNLSLWVNAVVGIYPGSNPQFSADGFTEYDNGPIVVDYQAGLLWQGPMAPGATGTSTITSSYSGSNWGSQVFINIPFALRPVPPTVINMPAVRTSPSTGVASETAGVPGPAQSASSSVQIGFSDRQLENLSARKLESNSFRLIEGSILVAAVTIKANLQSPVVIGSAAQFSIPVIVFAVRSTGYVPATGLLESIGASGVLVTGYTAPTPASGIFTVSSVNAIGYVGLTDGTRPINTVAVASIGYISGSSLTIGGGVYFAAAAVTATGYTGGANVTETIGIATAGATGYVSTVLLIVAGATIINVFAVGTAGLTGTEITRMAMAPNAVTVLGVVAPTTAGPGPIANAVSVTPLIGILTITAGIIQPPAVVSALPAGFFTDSIVVPGIVSAIGFADGTSGYPSPAQNAVGFTASIGDVLDTITVNQSTVSSIWFPASITAIQILNVIAPAVGATAYNGWTSVIIRANLSSVFATESTGDLAAIPNPSLDVSRKTTVRMSIDEFAGPSVVVIQSADEFGDPHLIVEKES